MALYRRETVGLKLKWGQDGAAVDLNTLRFAIVRGKCLVPTQQQQGLQVIFLNDSILNYLSFERTRIVLEEKCYSKRTNF